MPLLHVEALQSLLGGYNFVARQDATTSILRMLVGGVGFVLALPLARRGRPWPAMFLAAVFALAGLALVRLLSRTGIGAPVAQVAGVLTVALLVIGGWLLATSRLSREGAVALACGLVSPPFLFRSSAIRRSGPSELGRWAWGRSLSRAGS